MSASFCPASPAGASCLLGTCLSYHIRQPFHKPARLSFVSHCITISYVSDIARPDPTAGTGATYMSISQAKRAADSRKNVQFLRLSPTGQNPYAHQGTFPAASGLRGPYSAREAAKIRAAQSCFANT